MENIVGSDDTEKRRRVALEAVHSVEVGLHWLVTPSVRLRQLVMLVVESADKELRKLE